MTFEEAIKSGWGKLVDDAYRQVAGRGVREDELWRWIKRMGETYTPITAIHEGIRAELAATPPADTPTAPATPPFTAPPAAPAAPPIGSPPAPTNTPAGLPAYTDPNNLFTFGLSPGGLSGIESDFDALASALLGNYEAQRHAQVAAPIRRQYRQVAADQDKLLDLENVLNSGLSRPDRLAESFNALSRGAPARIAGAGRALLNQALNAYNTGLNTGFGGNTFASSFFSDSDTAQRMQRDSALAALESEVPAHMRAAVRDWFADLYGRYRAQAPASGGSGNLLTYLKGVGALG
jgi:hypothetical protein